MIEIRREQSNELIKKAKAHLKELLVEMQGVTRHYVVRSKRSGFSFTVHFKTGEGGRRFAECTCQAAVDRLCRHIGVVIGSNVYLDEANLIHRQQTKAL